MKKLQLNNAKKEQKVFLDVLGITIKNSQITQAHVLREKSEI